MNKLQNMEIHCEGLPPGIPSHHPHARVVGDFVYISGLIAREKGKNEIPGVKLDAKGEPVSQDMEEQFHAIMRNLKIILADCGTSLKNVIDITVFLTNIRGDFKKFNEVYGHYFGEIRPCRTTLEVNRFPSPVSIEIKVIAIR